MELCRVIRVPEKSRDGPQWVGPKPLWGQVLKRGKLARSAHAVQKQCGMCQRTGEGDVGLRAPEAGRS